MKQLKTAFITFCFLCLFLTSCVPGGARPAGGWSGVTYNDGLLYAGSRDGSIVAVNASARSVEWSYAISMPSKGMSCGQSSASVPIYSTPAADKDLVYIGFYNGKILALNTSVRSQGLPFPQARSGEWIFPRTNETIGEIVGNLVIDKNAIYVAVASSGDKKGGCKIYSLNKTFGDLNCSPSTLGEKCQKLWTTPAIDVDTIYASTFDGYIYSLSTKDLSLLPWTFKADAGFVSSPAVYQDTIFMGAFDNNLYAIEIGSSQPRWKFSGGSWFWATPVVKHGIVYAGCLDGKIYAVNVETGGLEWEFDTGSSIVSSLVWDGDLLIVASESGGIYIFDTQSEPENKAMMPVKTMPIDAVVQGSLCVQDNMIYVRAQDNDLYALDVEKGWVSWRLPLSITEES